MSDDEGPRIRPISDPLPVPVFSLVVYVRERDGEVYARVANLPDLAESASSEPLALKCLIQKAKQCLAAWHAADEAIPWLDPPAACDEGETERYIPLHL